MLMNSINFREMLGDLLMAGDDAGRQLRGLLPEREAERHHRRREVHLPGGARESVDQASFTRLVLGCIEANFCK